MVAELPVIQAKKILSGERTRFFMRSKIFCNRPRHADYEIVTVTNTRKLYFPHSGTIIIGNIIAGFSNSNKLFTGVRGC
jgi:hypothetical protein